MRKIILVGIFAMALPLLATVPAQAQAREYPWCARYD